MSPHALATYRQIKDLLFISFGILLYVTGYVCFQLPYHFTTGGVAGIAAVVFYSTGIPVQYTFLSLNVILLILALKVLGVKFMLNTIYAVLFMAMLMALMQDWVKNPDGTFPQLLGDQKFMSCVIAAVIEGLGLGVVFLNNGSTGGTDIIAAIVNKYRDVSLGRMIMLSDLLIISSSYLVFHSIELLLFGYCTMCSILLPQQVIGRYIQSILKPTAKISHGGKMEICFDSASSILLQGLASKYATSKLAISIKVIRKLKLHPTVLPLFKLKITILEVSIVVIIIANIY